MSGLEEYAQRCGEWLQKRVCEAEDADPLLRTLKDRVIEASQRAADADTSSMADRLAEQAEAIQALIRHAAQRSA